MASLAEALEWAGRGFRIFPCKPLSKTPDISAFQFVATTDPETIRLWWVDKLGRETDRNIGVLTTDMVVVDIDVKKGGQVAIDNYISIGGHYDTLVVETPTGGHHCYFNGPDSSLAVDIVPGVDIRSHNGYVLAPGSFVIDTDKGIAGAYTVVYDQPMAKVPEGIRSFLKPPRVRAAEAGRIEDDSPSNIANAIVWLREQPGAIEGAGGDILTYKIAATLVRDYALSPETAFHIMADHWNHKCKPRPWPLEMLWNKVENADHYATGAEGTKSPEQMFSNVYVPPPPPEEPLPIDDISFGNALSIAHVPPRPWIIPGMLARREVSLMLAPGGTGKSVWQIIVAAHLALGKNIDDDTKIVTAPARSILYNAEDDIYEQTRRLQAVCTAYNFDFRTVSNRIMFVTKQKFPLFLATKDRNTPRVVEEHILRFIALCTSEPDVAFVGIDPLVNTHGLDENNNSDMQFLVDHVLRRIAHETMCGLMVAHHTSKPGLRGHRPGDVDMGRGASALGNSARIVFTMTGPTDNDLEDYHITEKERGSYVRMDDAKSNQSRKLGKPRWFKWETIRLANGDNAGVIKPTTMSYRAEMGQHTMALILRDHLLANSEAFISMQAAVQVLQAADPLYEKMAMNTLRGKIERAFVTGYAIPTGDGGSVDTIQVLRRNISGRDVVAVVLT